MTACADRLLLHGLIDGELDAANSIAIEAHLKSCAGCAAELRRLDALRMRLAEPGLRHHAPAGLRDRIAAQIAAETRPLPAAPARRGNRWMAGGGFTALAASLLLLLATPRLAATGVEDQIVASHVRSLLANHLTDVATSNRHVVKPWFNGRIDFAPPVVDLADRGFPLVGGRLDYIEGRVVAAIVYHRRLHSINLFVRPAGNIATRFAIATRRDGYSLERWDAGGLEYWAVSDIDPAELAQFHQIFASRVAS